MPNVVDIVVRSKDQTKGGFTSAKQEATGFQGSLKRVGETAAGFLSANLISNAADRIKTFISGSITAASDLNETMSKTDAVFGRSAGNIHDWAKGAVDSMGLSRNAAETAAGSLGLIFTQMGANGQAAAGMSEKWVQLASDIGSFNNADPTEVLDAMAGATRGEYDALQKYVPTISAATVEHEALAMSGKHSATELDAHDKLLAVQKIMFEQTTKAQGDFARTGDQNANSQKKASAAMENAQAALGKGLLPVMTVGAHVVEVFGNAIAAHPGLIMATATAVGALAVALGIASIRIMAMTQGTALNLVITKAAAVASKVWAAAQWLLNAALSANPIALVVIAIVALIAILVVAYKRSETFRNIVQGAFRAVTAAASAAWNWIKGHWPLLLAVLTGPVGAAVILIVRNWDKIRSGAVTAWNAVVSFVKGIPGRILGALGNLGNLLYQAGRNVIQGLIDGVKSMISSVGNAIGGVAQTIRDHLPFSPAKVGPLSGGGNPFRGGQNIARMIGEGITAGRGGVGKAMGGALGGAGGPGGGGVLTLRIESGGSRLDDLLVEVLRKSIRARGGDVQVVLGT